MKVFKFLSFLFALILISESFLIACPTCWGLLHMNVTSDEVGEMEVSLSKTDDDEMYDENFDGFTDYDKETMEELKNDE